TEMKFGARTLPEAIVATARTWPSQTITQDITMKEVSYRKLLIGAELLASRWKESFGGQSRIGVLLPNVNAMPVVLLSLWAAGKVPAILNYTTGPSTLASCVRLADLKWVITARSFIERAGLDLASLEKSGIRLVYLEDVRKTIPTMSRWSVAARALLRPTLT